MIRIQNYQYFFDSKFTTPMLMQMQMNDERSRER